MTQAFIGDAFYELHVRRRLADSGKGYTADKLHLNAVRYVKASSQSKAIHTMIDEGILSDEELDIVRRARNRKPKAVPKNSDILEYKFATALEALVGYHYMEGRAGRAEELAEIAMQMIDESALK